MNLIFSFWNRFFADALKLFSSLMEGYNVFVLLYDSNAFRRHSPRKSNYQLQLITKNSPGSVNKV